MKGCFTALHSGGTIRANQLLNMKKTTTRVKKPQRPKVRTQARLRKTGKITSKSVSQPVNRTYVRRFSAPSRRPAKSAGRIGIVIKHREKFADVSASTDFTVQYFGDINPGCDSMFPWLSNEIKNWEKFKFRSLRFSYEHWSATNRGGAIYQAIDYNPSDPPPTTSSGIAAYFNSVVCSPSQDATCVYTAPALDRKELHLNRYTQGPILSIPDKTSINDYSAGKFVLATLAIDTPTGYASIIGELWVEYEVELWVQMTRLPGSDANDTTSKDNKYDGVTPSFTASGSTTNSTQALGFNGSLPNALFAGNAFLNQGPLTTIPKPLQDAAMNFIRNYTGSPPTAIPFVNKFTKAGLYQATMDAVFPTAFSNGPLLPLPLSGLALGSSAWNNSNTMYIIDSGSSTTSPGLLNLTWALFDIVDPAHSTLGFVSMKPAATQPNGILSNLDLTFIELDQPVFDKILANSFSAEIWDITDPEVPTLTAAATSSLEGLYQSTIVLGNSASSVAPFGTSRLFSNPLPSFTFTNNKITVNYGGKFIASFRFVGTTITDLDCSSTFTDFEINQTVNVGATSVNAQLTLTSPCPPGTEFQFTVTDATTVTTSQTYIAILVDDFIN